MTVRTVRNGATNTDGQSVNLNQDYTFNQMTAIAEKISYFASEGVTNYYFSSSYSDPASNSFLLASGNLSQTVRFTYNSITNQTTMTGEDFTVTWSGTNIIICLIAAS